MRSSNPFFVRAGSKTFKLIAGLAAALATEYGQTACSAEAPRVAKAAPDDGDKNVDPKLKLLVVEFDQGMSPDGMSLCGLAEADVAGKPRWKSPRIFEVPLKLKPNHKYEWSINCPSAKNFKSASGESAAIYPIRFKTATAGGKTKASPAPSLDEKQAAIKELRKCIDEFYSYRDLRRLDWDRIFEEHGPRLEAAASWKTFADECAQLLAAARDIHITIETADGDLLATFRRDVRPNFKFAQVKAQIPDLKTHNRGVVSGQLADGIGYILIGSWSGGKNSDLEPAFEALKEFAKAPGLIVDVRPNAGGNEELARAFAGCFHQKPAVYSRNLIRDASQPNGFTKLFDRQVEPTADRPAISIPVMVLMGPANMSSCESFLLMMRAAPKVLLVGDRSYGSSGNPKPHEIGGGIKVLLPSWKDFMPDGTLLEGHGILPEISVPPGADDLEGTDPVLDIALARLRK